MVLLTLVAEALYWHAWRTFEFVAPSQSLVLPLSLFASAAVGSLLGAQLRLSWIITSAATVGGLLVLYYAGSAEWIGWFLPEPVCGLLGGWFEHSFAVEGVMRAVIGDGSYVAAACWALFGLWTIGGLAFGAALRVRDRSHWRRTVIGMTGILVAANLLLASVFYPLTCAEKREMDYSYERIRDLGQAYSELKQKASPRGTPR